MINIIQHTEKNKDGCTGDMRETHMRYCNINTMEREREKATLRYHRQ